MQQPYELTGPQLHLVVKRRLEVKLHTVDGRCGRPTGGCDGRGARGRRWRLAGGNAVDAELGACRRRWNRREWLLLLVAADRQVQRLRAVLAQRRLARETRHGCSTCSCSGGRPDNRSGSSSGRTGRLRYWLIGLVFLLLLLLLWLLWLLHLWLWLCLTVTCRRGHGTVGIGQRADGPIDGRRRLLDDWCGREALRVGAEGVVSVLALARHGAFPGAGTEGTAALIAIHAQVVIAVIAVGSWRAGREHDVGTPADSAVADNEVGQELRDRAQAEAGRLGRGRSRRDGRRRVEEGPIELLVVVEPLALHLLLALVEEEVDEKEDDEEAGEDADGDAGLGSSTSIAALGF